MQSEVARPNPACGRYFGRDGQRGKDALRELTAGLRKYALLTGNGLPSQTGSPPLSPGATSPRSPLPPFGAAPAQPRPAPAGGSSDPATPPGLSLTLIQEVTRYVPHGFTTRSVVKHLVLPLSSPHRTALCDLPGLLHRKQVTTATVHVVHAWDAPFQDLSAMLQEYLAQQALPSNTSIFVDVLSANLHSTSTVSQKIKEVKAQLRAAPSIVIILSSSGALNRTWVLYQIWLVAREHLMDKMTLLLAPPLDKEMVKLAAQGISLRHSMAAQEDKDAILADVLRSHTASSTFDQEVLQAITRKLMTPAEEDEYLRSLEFAEAARQVQAAASAAEEARLRRELQDFQETVVPPKPAPKPAPPPSPPPQACSPPRSSAASPFAPAQALTDTGAATDGGAVTDAGAVEPLKRISAAGGFDPSSFMASFLGLAKAASSNAEDLPSAESLVGGPKAFVPPVWTGEGTLLVQLSPAVMGLLARLYKAAYFNQQRLVGMVHQFDVEDKGYMTLKEMEEFIDFFAENAVPAQAKVLAEAIHYHAQGCITADNLIDSLKVVETSGMGPAPEGTIVTIAEAEKEEEEEVAAAAAAEPLTQGATFLLSRLYKAVYFNQERLLGMVAQFDDKDVGYLTLGGMTEFIDFFAEATDPADAKLLAAAVVHAAGGRVDSDNMVDALKAVQAAAEASPTPAPAPAAAAAAAAEPEPAVQELAPAVEEGAGAAPVREKEEIPTFGEPRESVNPLQALAMGRLGTPTQQQQDEVSEPMEQAQEPEAEAGTGAVLQPEAASEAPEPVAPGAMTPAVLNLLSRLYKAVYFNQERLLGMVAQFDDKDLGYLTLGEMTEFIDFFAESTNPADARTLAAAAVNAAGGRISADNMVDALKALQASADGPRAAAPAATSPEAEEAPAAAAPKFSKQESMNRLAELATGRAAEPAPEPLEATAEAPEEAHAHEQAHAAPEEAAPAASEDVAGAGAEIAGPSTSQEEPAEPGPAAEEQAEAEAREAEAEAAPAAESPEEAQAPAAEDGAPAAAAAAATEKLPPPTAALLSRLYKAVYFNQERLYGMLAQFDEQDKGSLTPQELEHFIDFFADGSDAAGTSTLAAAIVKAAGGCVDANTIISALNSVKQQQA